MSSMLPNQELSGAIARAREREVRDTIERRSRLAAVASARAADASMDRREHGRLTQLVLHHLRHAAPAATPARPSVRPR